jgi:hypothetical protein
MTCLEPWRTTRCSFMKDPLRTGLRCYAHCPIVPLQHLGVQKSCAILSDGRRDEKQMCLVHSWIQMCLQSLCPLYVDCSTQAGDKRATSCREGSHEEARVAWWSAVCTWEDRALLVPSQHHVKKEPWP